MTEQISVITPVYHGSKYINGLLHQLEKCAAESRGAYTLELVLVNDDPQEPLEMYTSGKLKIQILQTDKNRGIHGARVYGLAHSTGSYILFLDQDDHIESGYFRSQLKCMGDNDASVCRLLHEGKQFYDTRMPFTSVINREYMTSVRNPIISPGQVLIKKNKIPELWKHARLKNNGADDWLLWLCMLGENSSFALNPEILFEHVVDGHNESMNMKHMMDSEEEMYHVLSAGGIFSDKELECVHNAVRNAAREHINTLCRFQKMFFVYETWIRLWEDGLYLHDYLKQNGICSVAVYAAGYIGRRLYDSLKKSGTRVLYFIDINAKYLRMDIPVYLPDMCLPDVDMIIVSLLEEERSIIKKLSSVSDAQICSVTKLLNDVGGMNHGREI